MSDSRPGLRVVRGDPSPEDIAALTALLSAAGDAEPPAEPPALGRWNDPARQHQRPLRHGPGGWRAGG